MITVLRKGFLTMAAMAGMLAIFTGCDDEKEIKVRDLPGAAREFVAQYFPDESILYAEKEKDDKVVTYNVRLSDGTEIEFDESGVWTSVDCNLSPVPDGIVPYAILTHLESYVPGGTQIFKIEKMWGGYEIEIRDGRDLIYDAEGNFVREDRG